MNLGAKIAFIVITIGLLAGGIIFSAAAIIFTEDFKDLERRDGESRLALLEEEINGDLLAMRATVGEFSQIALILIAAPDSNNTANLTAQLLSGNKIDAIGFGFDGFVQGLEYDWDSMELVNSTLPVFDELVNSTYATNSDSTQTLSGFVRGDARYLVASQGLSFGNQSANLIILRALDDDYLASLKTSQLTHINWHEGGKSGVWAEGSVLHGSIPFFDEDGNSIGSVHVEMSREITENADKTFIILGIGYVVVVFIFGVVIVVLLKKFVLGRVRTARMSMEKIAREQSWKESMNLGGNDEIAHMADQFNILMKELESARLELESTNNSLERYARSLSHDLRSPLSTLSLNLHLLALRDDGEEIPKMQRTVKRIDEQILALLEDAKKRAAGFTDANASIHAVLEDLEGEIAGQNAVVNVSPLPLVPLAASQLRSLMQNIISNSIKFHRGSGSTIDVSGGVYESGAYIIIQDDGIGMTSEKMGKVKEEFVGDGYGIGLATCFAIMDPVGRIDIESEEGVGTRFTLWFEE